MPFIGFNQGTSNFLFDDQTIGNRKNVVDTTTILHFPLTIRILYILTIKLFVCVLERKREKESESEREREKVVRGTDAERSNDRETRRIKNMNSDNKIFIKNNIYFDEQ